MLEVMKIMMITSKMSHAGTAIQYPQPCSRPPPTHTSARDSWTLTGKSDPYLSGDTQTQCYLSLCGVSGSWCAQVMFEPSEHLWRVWSLILNMISHIPYHLAGLLLCPWTWGIMQLLQHHAAATPPMQPPLQWHRVRAQLNSKTTPISTEYNGHP